MKKIIKCRQCNKHRATQECPECGEKVCGWCARKADYQCFYCEPPSFEPIRN